MTTALIVDDEPWQVAAHKRALEATGISVVSGTHAASAIELIDVHKPDVLILDLLLPGGTAWLLLHELQSHSDTSALPVILVTSAAETVDQSLVEAYGVKVVIDKAELLPGELSSLVTAVTA